MNTSTIRLANFVYVVRLCARFIAAASEEYARLSVDVRTHGGIATLTQPGQPTHDVALARRNLRDCLADELRRLDPDELYGEVITGGLATLGAPSAITEGPLA